MIKGSQAEITYPKNGPSSKNAVKITPEPNNNKIVL